MMTDHKRSATNPLTGEQVVIQDFINDLVDSTRLDVLRALDGQSMSPTTVQNHGLTSRQTASKHFTQFTDLGLVKSADEQSEYKLTAGGQLTLNAVETCLGEIDRERLEDLTRSTHLMRLLRTLSTASARPSDLAEIDANSPSRATVQRALQMFVSEGWSSEEHGKHRLTPRGERVLDAYDELAVSIEQVMEKAPWFQRLSPARADVPVHALSDAKMLVSNPDSPGLVFAAALKLCDPRLNHFRGLTSIYNPTLFTAYDKLLKLGLKGETIVDAYVSNRLHDEGKEHFLDDSEYENFRILRLREPLTLGIALYDDQKVAIGTYNETGEGDHIAMILSSNEALIEWGNDLYNSYQEQAWHPTEHIPGPS